MASINFRKEKSLIGKGFKIVVGIDEAGRGSLAGPITAAALAVIGPLSNLKFLISKQEKNLRFLKDSKKLTSKKREEFYKILTRHPQICWTVTSVGPKTIDRINVARSANLAAERAFKKLITKICLPEVFLAKNAKKQSLKVLKQSLKNFNSVSRKERQSHSKIFILLDGSLSFKSNCPQETIIKGDEKIWSIAAASIIAKVTRDRKMKRLAKKFPEYGLEIHKGYGTKLHYQRLRKYGPSEIHRRSFLKGIS